MPPSRPGCRRTSQLEDICVLHTGRALNILIGDESDVPDVDLFVAGFVCKSVCTENTQRQ